jgi:hypothetical protein
MNGAPAGCSRVACESSLGTVAGSVRAAWRARGIGRRSMTVTVSRGMPGQRRGGTSQMRAMRLDQRERAAVRAGSAVRAESGGGLAARGFCFGPGGLLR